MVPSLGTQARDSDHGLFAARTARLAKDETVQAIAERLDATPVQVALPFDYVQIYDVVNKRATTRASEC
jgi:diketogulonate reductase-like aldo/keto reductase